MLTPIRTYSSPEEAYIVQGFLNSYGIESEVGGSESNSVFPSLDDGFNGITIYVDERRYPEAEELLTRHGD